MTLYNHLCCHCGRYYSSEKKRQLHCSEDCWQATQKQLRNADKQFRSGGTHKDRCRKFGGKYDEISKDTLLEVVYAATHCGICKAEYKENDRRSLDHIIPIYCGGAHSLSNIQSAHLSCNVSANRKIKTQSA